MPTDDEAAAHREQVVLIVDDEVDILESLKDLLEASLENVRAETAESGPAALEKIAKHPFDLIITDFKMPGMNGLEFLEQAHQTAPGIPRILVTAFPDLQIAIRAINEAGIDNFFTKPFDPGQVIDVVRMLLMERRAHELRSRSFARSLEILRKKLD